MSHPVIFPASLDVVTRWAECRERDSVMCWRALSNVLLAYARLAFHDNQFATANDLVTLSELAQQHACILAPFQDVAA